MSNALAVIMLGVLVVCALDSTGATSAMRIPDDERDMAQRASNMFSERHYDEAAGLYRIIIRDHPDSLYAWTNLAVVRFMQGRYDDAHAALARVVALTPKDASSLSSLGITEFEMKDYPASVKHLQASVALDPKDCITHRILSQSLDALGRHAEAAAEEIKAEALENRRDIQNLQDGVVDDKTQKSS